MREFPARLKRDRATVRTYRGESSVEPILSDAVTVAGKWSLTRQLARNDAGDEVLCELVGYVSPSAAALFPPKSEVTACGRTGLVISLGTSSRPGQAVLTKVMCT